jgi:4-amino-4-deoxy-L-arabinose transferase-like glycosyltransferase
MSLLGGLAAVTVIAAAYNVQAHASWPGLGDIDAFAIWMFKAKWVSLSALRPMPPVFWEPGLSYSHQDYPLGFPFLIAGLYAAAGRMDDGLARTLLLPQYLALVAVVYAAMRRMHRRAMAVTITAIFTAAPALVQNAGLAVAETPLLLMYAAALAMMLRWMEGGSSGELMLAAIFVAAAAFTKNEGLALMPVIGVLAFVFAISSRQKIVQWAKACGISIALIVPWLVYRMYLPRTHEDYGGKLRNAAMVIGNLPRLQQVLPGFLGHMFDASYAGLIWSVLIVVTVIGWRGLRRRAVRVLWVLLLMQLSMYVATFVVTPWKVDVLLNMISAKLLVQASPVAVLLIGLLMRRSDAVEATPVPR